MIDAIPTDSTISIYTCTRGSLDESGSTTGETGDDCPVCNGVLSSSLAAEGGVYDSDDCWCEDCGYVDSWVVDGDGEDASVYLGNGCTGTELRVLDTHVPLNADWLDHLSGFNYEIVVDGEDENGDESEDTEDTEEQLVPPASPNL